MKKYRVTMFLLTGSPAFSACIRVVSVLESTTTKHNNRETEV